MGFDLIVMNLDVLSMTITFLHYFMSSLPRVPKQYDDLAKLCVTKNIGLQMFSMMMENDR